MYVVKLERHIIQYFEACEISFFILILITQRNRRLLPFITEEKIQEIK